MTRSFDDKKPVRRSRRKRKRRRRRRRGRNNGKGWILQPDHLGNVYRI